jgi:hypothetical protein
MARMEDIVTHIQICFREDFNEPRRWIDACDPSLSVKYDFNGIAVARALFATNCAKCKERRNKVLDGLKS